MAKSMGPIHVRCDVKRSRVLLFVDGCYVACKMLGVVSSLVSPPEFPHASFLCLLSFVLSAQGGRPVAGKE